MGLTKEDRVYRHVYHRNCECCLAPFDTWNRASRYCTHLCRSRASKARTRNNTPGHWLTVAVNCGICGIPFKRKESSGPNKKYCSDTCTAKARRQKLRQFMVKEVGAMSNYNTTRRRTHGRDTLITRLRKLYPDLPNVCEATNCNESRVLEVVHRPEFKRNGEWRMVSNSERHMIWILCPTCHRVLDRGIETPEQLGLQ